MCNSFKFGISFNLRVLYWRDCIEHIYQSIHNQFIKEEKNLTSSTSGCCMLLSYTHYVIKLYAIYGAVWQTLWMFAYVRNTLSGHTIRFFLLFSLPEVKFQVFSKFIWDLQVRTLFKHIVNGDQSSFSVCFSIEDMFDYHQIYL